MAHRRLDTLDDDYDRSKFNRGMSNSQASACQWMQQQHAAMLWHSVTQNHVVKGQLNASAPDFAIQEDSTTLEHPGYRPRCKTQEFLPSQLAGMPSMVSPCAHTVQGMQCHSNHEAGLTSPHDADHAETQCVADGTSTAGHTFGQQAGFDDEFPCLQVLDKR